MSIPITEKTLLSFKLTKKFRSNFPKQDIPAQTSNLSFDDSGQFLITTNFNQSIQLFDAQKGKHIKSIQSQKYGCHLAKFTHTTAQNCIYSSTKNNDHTIRYLSLDDNSYIRYFKGHRDFVTSMEVSPTHDVFISSSFDKTIRLWDLRASNQQGLTSLAGEFPIATAFDPSGLVIGIADKNKVHLKDIKMFAKESFLTIDLPEGFQFNKIEFSNDNKYILLSSINGDNLIVDSFENKVLMRLTGMAPPPLDIPTCGSACFTPDSKFVLAGQANGSVSVFKIDPNLTKKVQKNGSTKNPGYDILDPIAQLTSEFDSRPRMVLFNSKFQEFITADTDVCMWVPENVI